MGCVLGKRAAKDRQKSSGARGRIKTSSNAANNVTTVVKDRNGGADSEKQKVHGTREFQAPEWRNMNPMMGMRGQQGWPSWLLDAAGDAIQSWTPRRANTFEKIDKVLIWKSLI